MGVPPEVSSATPVRPVVWGRRTKATWLNKIGAALLIPACPFWAILSWIALENFRGSLLSALTTLISDFQHIVDYLPKPSWTATLGYCTWLILQAFLYRILPGKICTGQRTPGGHLLKYKANGVAAWTATHLLFALAVYTGCLDPAFIAKNWQGLLVAANVYGFLLAALVQIKGYWMPSYPNDRKLSGSWIYDFCAGVELNPQLGPNWDLKFFHNGRPGMVAWTLIDLSYAAYQFETHGHISASMIIVIILHATYVVHFFFNEDWYVRTIDITHEHFGFMLSWGDSTFLPSFYTMQAQYLTRYPTVLSGMEATAILAVGLASYAAFRSSNGQKHRVRESGGTTTVWFRPAAFLRAQYSTKDNQQHESLLLTSGWWGLSRHANYTADLVQSWAMCAPCAGHKGAFLLPWGYFFWMCILLHDRILRDERRCKEKYGHTWDEYCRLVPWRLVRGIY